MSLFAQMLGTSRKVSLQVYFLVKSTLFDVPVLGAILRAGGQIPIHRATKEAGDSLKEARGWCRYLCPLLWA